MNRTARPPYEAVAVSSKVRELSEAPSNLGDSTQFRELVLSIIDR